MEQIIQTRETHKNIHARKQGQGVEDPFRISDTGRSPKYLPQRTALRSNAPGLGNAGPSPGT